MRPKRSRARKVVPMTVLDPSSMLLDNIQPGQLVTISGLAGSGRTTLARTIAASLVQRGHRVGVVSMQPQDTDRAGLNIEYQPIEHHALAADADRPDSTTAVVYDYGSSWASEELADAITADLTAARIVILVSMPTPLTERADVRVIVGRPTRRLFAEVYGIEAPSEGVPAPRRGTAFVAAPGADPILITYRAA